jgi:hypothetical protein
MPPIASSVLSPLGPGRRIHTPSISGDSSSVELKSSQLLPYTIKESNTTLKEIFLIFIICFLKKYKQQQHVAAEKGGKIAEK